MRSNSRKRRPIAGLMFCGLLLAVFCIRESSPAAAGGGFGGGFGTNYGAGEPAAGVDQPPRQHLPATRRGAGKVVKQPSVRSGRNSGNEDRGGSRHHRVISPGLGGNAGPDLSESTNRGAGGNNGRSGVPPNGEQRFVPGEILTEFGPNATPQSIDQIARRYDLTRLESQSLPLIGSTVYRWRVGGSRSAADVVGAIENERTVSSAQPNYIFTLQEQAATIADDGQEEAAQYVLSKLLIKQAHQLATGKNTLIAVIDSEIDAEHPDLAGTIVKSFNASSGGDTNPDKHGTAIAGAIASHGKLLGIAPGAQLLVVRAFDDAAVGGRGTSFAIYKALQWAADSGARVVNMSFAGPPDPAMHRILTAAYEKGIVLIAAAGNAGPNSPPLYPAADPDVIAVAATDSHDGLFNMSNRGEYIAIAAPGVDIISAAPAESYQITTGTSVAAAHVSGVVALLLETKPSLNPKDIRAILMASATRPENGQHPTGAGLVNAYRAVNSLNGNPIDKNDGDDQAKR
jgi:subtilisin family serine protease